MEVQERLTNVNSLLRRSREKSVEISCNPELHCLLVALQIKTCAKFVITRFSSCEVMGQLGQAPHVLVEILGML